ncbi:hypothetical protein ANAEL_04604 [Anaerolineales bacterium]|nr:hypothetical protein ANAEL_04604 [Anaerolineales bacterium]
MTPNFQRIRDALTRHCLDSMGNIYTITMDDVVDYIEKELPPTMKAQLDAIDEVSLAIEIADAIGNAGIMEQIEAAICETVKTQIQIAREAALEAHCENIFIEEVCS